MSELRSAGIKEGKSLHIRDVKVEPPREELKDILRVHAVGTDGEQVDRCFGGLHDKFGIRRQEEPAIEYARIVGVLVLVLHRTGLVRPGERSLKTEGIDVQADILLHVNGGVSAAA